MADDFIPATLKLKRRRGGGTFTLDIPDDTVLENVHWCFVRFVTKGKVLYPELCVFQRVSSCRSFYTKVCLLDYSVSIVEKGSADLSF